MARWQPQKKDVLDALATEILHNYARGRVAIAVDGPDDPRTAEFADDLADALRDAGHAVVRASVAPVATEAGGAEASAEQFYTDGHDYARLRSSVVDPFRSGDGEANTILLVDGVFLNRPELRGIWNYSIWLDVAAVADQLPERARATYRLYNAEAAPRARAGAIVDLADPQHPRRIFADSC